MESWIEPDRDAGSYDHGNESWFHKIGEFLDQLRNFSFTYLLGLLDYDHEVALNQACHPNSN
jgi:hypothetical protein